MFWDKALLPGANINFSSFTMREETCFSELWQWSHSLVTLVLHGGKEWWREGAEMVKERVRLGAGAGSRPSEVGDKARGGSDWPHPLTYACIHYFSFHLPSMLFLSVSLFFLSSDLLHQTLSRAEKVEKSKKNAGQLTAFHSFLNKLEDMDVCVSLSQF